MWERVGQIMCRSASGRSGRGKGSNIAKQESREFSTWSCAQQVSDEGDKSCEARMPEDAAQ